MQLGIGSHLEDGDLEKYSMRRLPEECLAPFEEHFLICESCQDRLLEMEAYVNAIRSVSPKLRAARKPKKWPRVAWASGAALALAAALILVRIPGGVTCVLRLEARRRV